MKTAKDWTVTIVFSALLASLAPAAGAAEGQGGAAAAAPAPVLNSFDAVVEAERQTVMAAQVAGAVAEILVKAGERVKAGQVLLRMDGQAAVQSAQAATAQVQSAQAALAVATRDFDRQKQLAAQDYISQAALERAEARFKAAQAETNAQIAQANAARAQAGYYTLRAPYAGVVAEVPVVVGDMALPGRPLLTLYDPSRLRVTAAVPQAVVDAGLNAGTVKIELPGRPEGQQWVVPTSFKVLPTVDSATHTMEMRLGLPAAVSGVTPGQFARAWMPGSEKMAAPVRVPLAAVVHRAEMTGLYVLDAQGRPLLRQVRLGRVWNDQVEILSGLNPGERVAPDAQAALTAAH
ncbi:MAG: efflux RND transporter periplasmic adaptor subunit [Betaproteobacteria bacterium]|nr:efflux RND transporter periplasmic adaptor subunit [Betaproteobacteria bacterium]